MTKGRINVYYVIITVLSLAIVGLSVGYAALSTTLKVTFGNVTQAVNTWNVGFKPGSVTAEVGGTSDTGRVCGNATVTTNTATVDAATLSKPGDSCTYALTIENKGSIAANLASITPTYPGETSCTTSGASMVCGNITYKLTTDSSGNDLLTAPKTLAATSGTLPIYLVVEYTGEDLSESASPQTNASFTLTYNQA